MIFKYIYGAFKPTIPTIGFAFFILLLSTSSCGNQVIHTKGYFPEHFSGDTIPYQLATMAEPSPRLLIFLSPMLDTIDFTEWDAFNDILKRNYDILIPEKPVPQGKMYYFRKGRDARDYRIQDVERLVKHLKQSGQIHPKASISLLGIGEGAALIPELSIRFKADTCLFVNAGPFSRFMQLEQIASGRIKLTEPRKQYLKQKFGVETAEGLDSVLHRVRTESSDKIILADQTNLYWTSYHGNFFLRDYQYLKTHTAWFIFEEHPLGKKSDYEYLKVLDSTRPSGEASYHFLPGNGNLNSEENQELLKEQLMVYFPK